MWPCAPSPLELALEVSGDEGSAAEAHFAAAAVAPVTSAEVPTAAEVLQDERPAGAQECVWYDVGTPREVQAIHATSTGTR